MDSSVNIVILGASTKKERYSNKAIVALKKHGYYIIPIGREVGLKVNGYPIIGSFEELTDERIDTITIYLSESNQSQYQKRIVQLNPRRVIFNPGAENMELYSLLKKNNVEVMNACTLVMLSVGTF